MRPIEKAIVSSPVVTDDDESENLFYYIVFSLTSMN